MRRREVNLIIQEKCAYINFNKYINADILRITKTIDLLTFIKSQQLKYVINILKRSDKSITKRLLFNDDKTTKRGRPHMTLMTSVLAEYGSLEEMIEFQV